MKKSLMVMLVCLSMVSAGTAMANTTKAGYFSVKQKQEELVLSKGLFAKSPSMEAILRTMITKGSVSVAWKENAKGTEFLHWVGTSQGSSFSMNVEGKKSVHGWNNVVWQMSLFGDTGTPSLAPSKVVKLCMPQKVSASCAPMHSQSTGKTT